MRKSDIKLKMREGFSELSPDIFEQVMKATEQERPKLQEMETENIEDHLETGKTEGLKKKCFFGKENIFLGSFTKYAISACASLAIFCICLFGIFGRDQNDIYLILDINPSIQIVMNDSFQVKRLQGLNQDGRDVIKKLKWNKKERIFDTLDSVIEGVVKDSYLERDSGILVTICLQDFEIYEDLKDKMGKNIDHKLKEIGISGVIAAFQQGEKDSVQKGRTILETELTEVYGIDAGQVQQMSVMDLIFCGREYGVSGVTYSPESDKQWEEFSKQKKEQEEKEKQEEQEKAKPEDPSPDKNKPQEKELTEEKPEPEKVQDNQPKQKETEVEKKREKENTGKDIQNSIPVQQQENATPSVPAEVPALTPPANSAAPNETQSESNVDTSEDDKDKNVNNGKGKDKKEDKKKGNKKKKDKNGNSKNNKNKNGNSKNKKDKDGNSSENKEKDKNVNNKNKKDKDGASRENKDKDKNGNRENKDKDKNGAGTENRDKDKNGNSNNNNGSSERKDINKSSPIADKILLEDI
ncbi:MAG: hypothetical protein HFI70_07230 [Lachnospiraceae bacterium]|nr:hypothetical protein [Lachnospiraceae bacterium]